VFQLPRNAFFQGLLVFTGKVTVNGLHFCLCLAIANNFHAGHPCKHLEFTCRWPGTNPAPCRSGCPVWLTFPSDYRLFFETVPPIYFPKKKFRLYCFFKTGLVSLISLVN